MNTLERSVSVLIRASILSSAVAAGYFTCLGGLKPEAGGLPGLARAPGRGMPELVLTDGVS